MFQISGGPSQSKFEDASAYCETVDEMLYTSRPNEVAPKRKREESCRLGLGTKKFQMDAKELCRICLEPIAAVPVSLSSSVQEFLEDGLKFTYLSIVDLPQYLPQNVCSECYGNLVSFQRFYKQCSKANELLKEKLGVFVKKEIDAEPSGDDFLNYQPVEDLNAAFPGAEEKFVMECKFDDNYDENNEAMVDQHDLEVAGNAGITTGLKDPSALMSYDIYVDGQKEISQEGSMKGQNSQHESDSECILDNSVNCKYCGTSPHYHCHNCKESAKIIKQLQATIYSQNTAIMGALAEQKFLISKIIRRGSVEQSIGELFPIPSEDKLGELNEQLRPENIATYISVIRTILKNDLNKNLKHVLSDEIVVAFNIDGTHGKKKLKDYEQVFKIIIDAIKSLASTTGGAEEQLRKAIQLQKKRHFKKISIAKKDLQL